MLIKLFIEILKWITNNKIEDYSIIFNPIVKNPTCKTAILKTCAFSNTQLLYVKQKGSNFLLFINNRFLLNPFKTRGIL